MKEKVPTEDIESENEQTEEKENTCRRECEKVVGGIKHCGKHSVDFIFRRCSSWLGLESVVRGELSVSTKEV